MLTKFAKRIIDLPTKKLFYNAYIKPHFDYSSPIWDGCCENHFKRLNSLHRRAAKLILPCSNLTTDETLVQLNMLPLQKQLLVNKAMLMHKIVDGKAPQYLLTMFRHSQTRYINQRNNLVVTRPRIDLFKTSFSFSGASLWNSLPTKVKSLKSHKAFRNALYKLFFRP
jgi:hypothetical protein